ncbi:hemolysin-III related-domain-containing protein [Mycena amicta]|nr:hemolysin-III related-domain-containing protein [Mycena amicta]
MSLAALRPRLPRRRMSAPPPRPTPARLPQCRPLSLSLEALDLCSASPAQVLASLRFIILSFLADLESRLSGMERAATALEMLHSIQAEVRSHLPDLGAHLPDIDELRTRLNLPDIDQLKSLISGLDFSRPLSYVPTLSAHLRRLHDHIADADLTFDFEFTRPSFDFDFRRPSFDFEFSRPSFDFEFSRPSFDFEFTHLPFDLPILSDLADVLDAFRADVDAFLADIPQLPSLPASLSFPSLPATLSRASSSISYTLSPAAPESSDEEKDAVAHALALSAHGHRLIGYDDLPAAWRNNPFVQGGYRFIPLSNWRALLFSVFHNETLNIHTHLVPLVLWSVAFAGVWINPAENLFTLFALACLGCSVVWHVMAGCAHRGPMETCARIDYVGIGWLIATSIATVIEDSSILPDIVASGLSMLVTALSSALLALSSVISGISDATVGRAKSLLVYHPFGAACLLLCFVCGVSGNILPFSEWFNRVENRLWRLGFFVSISFSALLPLAGIAALQGWDTMTSFMAPIGPSLVFYVVGLVIYATQFPECLLGGTRSRIVRFLVDRCGAGSHAIWHVFIVLAIRAHRDGIREMRRAAAEGGCAAGLIAWT